MEDFTAYDEAQEREWELHVAPIDHNLVEVTYHWLTIGDCDSCRRYFLSRGAEIVRWDAVKLTVTIKALARVHDDFEAQLEDEE